VRKICVINLKGGVGKTTTALNLAAGLSRSDRKVLLVDLDPQSNIELSINLSSSWTISDFLFGGVAISECLNSAGTNLDLVRGDSRMQRAEQEDPEKMLDRMKLIKGYDYIIFDCGPSMNMINKVALLLCKEAIMPTTTDYLGYESITRMVEFMKEFAEFNEHEIKLSKVVPTFFDVRNKICSMMLDKINNDYYQYISSPVRVNSKLKEAPMKKMSIFKYAPNSAGAKDYWALVQGVISDEPLYGFTPACDAAVEQAAVEEEE